MRRGSARGEHVIANDIGVGVEAPAQLAVEGFDVPAVHDDAALDYASLSLLATIRAHDECAPFFAGDIEQPVLERPRYVGWCFSHWR